MRLLFDLDKKDYAPMGSVYIRPSVRGIIICDGKIAMVHSVKYDYYKFPGGGIEKGETKEQGLVREVAEESGLVVRTETIREFGLVHRVQKSDRADRFVQDNYYYLCSVNDVPCAQHLDDYEAEEQFTLEFIEPEKAIQVNRYGEHGPKDRFMLEREARVLEILIREGYFRETARNP